MARLAHHDHAVGHEHHGDACTANQILQIVATMQAQKAGTPLQ